MTKPKCFGSEFIWNTDYTSMSGFPVRCEACDLIDDCIKASKANIASSHKTDKGACLSDGIKRLCRKKARIMLIDKYRDEYEQQIKELEAKALAVISCENEHGRITW
jgi:hypothetical protein